MSSLRLRYFAYGSNLHPVRLADRIGPAGLLGTATLPATRLAFNKLGRDGSGKGNLQLGQSDHQVCGAVYGMSPGQMEQLDRFESRGAGYERHSLSVWMNGRAQMVETYVAMPEHVREEAVAFSWYKALVIAGARYHSFPAGYLRILAATPARPDHDSERDSRWQRLADRLLAAL